MTAGVHYANLLAAVLGLDERLERYVGLFGDRQRVHIRTDRNHGARFATAQHADDARVRDARAYLELERPQVIGHELCGARLAIAELRVGVEVASPRDDARHDVSDGRVGSRL